MKTYSYLCECGNDEKGDIIRIMVTFDYLHEQNQLCEKTCHIAKLTNRDDFDKKNEAIIININVDNINDKKERISALKSNHQAEIAEFEKKHQKSISDIENNFVNEISNTPDEINRQMIREQYAELKSTQEINFNNEIYEIKLKHNTQIDRIQNPNNYNSDGSLVNYPQSGFFSRLIGFCIFLYIIGGVLLILIKGVWLNLCKKK